MLVRATELVERKPFLITVSFKPCSPPLYFSTSRSARGYEIHIDAESQKLLNSLEDS